MKRLIIIAAISVFIFVLIVAAFLLLRPKPAPVSPPKSAFPENAIPIASVTYACDGGHGIDASFFVIHSTSSASENQQPKPEGWVDLTLDKGKTLHLSQTISADGARYASEGGALVFWNKGRGATVFEHDKESAYTGCVEVAPDRSTLTQIYQNGTVGYTVRYPKEFVVDDTYVYQALGPGKDIHGTKFIIPDTMATGTNLSSDSYISIEAITATGTCGAKLFLSNSHLKQEEVLDGDITYSVASTTEAAAGNRYEELIYVLPTLNQCLAVRYFIHSSAIANYPKDSVQEFDHQTVTTLFDAIRRTLIVR